jgi:hypothetical protein
MIDYSKDGLSRPKRGYCAPEVPAGQAAGYLNPRRERAHHHIGANRFAHGNSQFTIRVTAVLCIRTPLVAVTVTV